ncbi:MAG: beta-propeller fold lactonase family protein, partial [Pirellulales bacterium]|nr:beta-propeller fold lactonase family protein [Pirellulales bacterium]
MLVVNTREPILAGPGEASGQVDRSLDRLPVDLALSPDGTWLVTANEGSDSVSLLRTADQQVVDERHVGGRPADIEFCPDGQHVLVTTAWSGQVHVLRVDQDRLQPARVIVVGFEPHGIAVSPQGNRAFVGLV